MKVRFSFLLCLLLLVTACGGGGGSASGTENTPPISNAGTDQNVTTGANVVLNGSNSSDADGDLLKYSWSFQSSPTGSSATLSDQTIVNPSFTADIDGSYVLRLVVNDGTVDSAEDTVTITATTSNSAPSANAGPDQNVTTGDVVNLNGSGNDADGDSLNYDWSFVSLPSGSSATLNDSTAANATFTADIDGTYILNLIVNDGAVDSMADAVTITATAANSAPTSNAGPDQYVTTGDVVYLSGSGADADGDVLAYNWSFVSVPSNSTTTLSDPTVANPTFTTDLDGSYVLSLVVNDGAENSVADNVVIISEPTPIAATLNNSLIQPWGLAFLPDNRMLVTEKTGSMLILSADGLTIQTEITGVPLVNSLGQGGLLDVALDPDFTIDPWIYWTYSEPGTGDEAGLTGTAVARGRLLGSTLQNVEVIYRQVPKVSGTGHFGSRLAFRNDKTLFVTLGERQLGSPAQDLSTTLGKVIRINRDGTIPADNPTISGALPEIWSYGHRNPQGAAIRPGEDFLWITEHGPQGGDELNKIIPGGNYGWPLVSYGCNYGDPVGDACRIGGGTHSPNYVEPISYWVPISIAPAGMIFYTADRIPQWQGDIFIGALAGTALWRIEMSGDTVVRREELFSELGERIRDVEQGPDGWLYLLTDSGKLIQIRSN